jgi:hypothetical protein
MWSDTKSHAEARLAKCGSEASAMNQSTDEAWRRDPQPSFRAPQRRLQGQGQAARVLRFSGVLPALTKMLRTRWVVLTHIKQLRPKASDMR